MNKTLLIVGICLLLLPIGFQFISKNKQENVIKTFEQEIKQVEKEESDQIFSAAREYNRKLYEEGWIDREAYVKQLVFSEKRREMMGSLAIPKIDCKLPIQKGTESESLADSVGHVIESSLPIGGMNTHSVLSGHRGLPGQELFTRLDELNEKDIFYISVGGRQLTYRVCRIQTVLPDDVNAVAIEKDRDLVSLVTCTPYGLNTHRLIVTGERVPEAVKVEVVPEIHSMSKWNLLPCIVVGCSLLIVMIRLVNNRKKREERAYEQYRGTASKRKGRKNFLFQSRKHAQRRFPAGKGIRGK